MSIYFITTAIIIAVLAFGGIAAVAWGQSGRRLPPARHGRLDRRAIGRDRARTRAMTRDRAAEEAAASERAESADDADQSAPLPPSARDRRVAVDAEAYSNTRRSFLNRALLGLFGGAFLTNLGISFLGFMWPKLGGGFGGKINAGKIDEIRDLVIASGGTVSPLFVPSAQAYVVPFAGDVEASQFGSATGVQLVIPGVAGAPGIMALWQRCVHLGCRVPQCLPSQGFECPCHGSKYNFHGEYEDGPAPRNLDRFAVSVDKAGSLIIDTGTIVETPRAKEKTIPYPQGPTCI